MRKISVTDQMKNEKIVNKQENSTKNKNYQDPSLYNASERISELNKHNREKNHFDNKNLNDYNKKTNSTVCQNSNDYRNNENMIIKV